VKYYRKKRFKKTGESRFLLFKNKIPKMKKNNFSSQNFKDPFNSLPLKKAFLLILIVFSFFIDLSILEWEEKISNEKTVTFSYPQKISPPWEGKIKKLVAGYPMEKMTPYISRQEKATAAFLVSVAKKESNWGKRAPLLAGKDCYNYWGYRGQSDKMTESGYTCFSSPAEAIFTVAKRFDDLRKNSGLNTPEKMIVWKCGWDCTGHSEKSVSKWISDVSYYFDQIY